MTIDVAVTGQPHRPARGRGADERELLRMGVRAMVHERLSEARTFLEAAAAPAGSLSAADSSAPSAAAIDALAYLGSVRWALGDVEGGRAAAERALALGPERFAPNQKAGEAALRLGDVERAAELFLAALRVSEPGSREAKVAETSLRTARGRMARGIRHGATMPRLPAFAALRRRIAPLGRRDRTSAPEA